MFQSWLQRRGATLAPPELSTHLTLLGLQVKAEYIYFFVPHPPTLPQFLFAPFSFQFFFSTTHLLMYFLSACFFCCPSASEVFCFVFLHSAPGRRTLQWNRMFPPVQLPVDNHSVSFTNAHFHSLFSSASSLQGHQHLLLCFLSNILFPPVVSATSPNESLHQLTGLFMRNVVCVG